jgi:uncharacterized circularly permuted ATP-grasp superfamily protein
MPVTNLISIEFTDAELTQMDQALLILETIFKDKAVQFTPKESQKYGKLGDETENWVNMIYTDTETATDLVPQFVDRTEWAKDEKVRNQLSKRSTRLENIATQIADTNRLVGFDIYQTCRSVYNNTKYLSTQNIPGAKAYYEKWSTQFKGKNRKKENEE